MTVRKTTRRGKPVLVIDIPYTRPDGTKDRYRKDAQVQTATAAREEDKRLVAQLVTQGYIGDALPPVSSRSSEAVQHDGDDAPQAPTMVVVTTKEPTKTAARKEVVTFQKAVDHFFETKAKVALKASTRRGYREMIDGVLLPRFKELPLSAINNLAVTKLLADLREAGNSRSRMRNIQCVIRSVLKAALEHELVDEIPTQPKLLKVGSTIQQAFTPEQIEKLLEKAHPALQLALSLASFAGLRAGEVRALRWTDVDLRRKELIVRFAKDREVIDTPKSGHARKVPLTPRLVTLLEEATRKTGLDVVALSRWGKPWSGPGLVAAFKRAAKRAGIEGFRLHDLRHFFVTSLFRSGSSGPVVQALAGHNHLTTTQRYAHVVEEDKAAAIGRLAAFSSPATTAA